MTMDDETREGTELDVTLESLGDLALIVLSGEVDVYSAPRLRNVIRDLVDKGKYRMVVDLEKVAFMDSTGLGVLVGGLKRVKRHQGELGIICNQERILRIFRITGLTKVFPIYRSREDLLASIEGA